MRLYRLDVETFMRHTKGSGFSSLYSCCFCIYDMKPTERARGFSPQSLVTRPANKDVDMSDFNIKLTLDLHCRNTDEQDQELDILCDFITDRLHIVGVDVVLQSLAEALIELHDQNAEEKAKFLH